MVFCCGTCTNPNFAQFSSTVADVQKPSVIWYMGTSVYLMINGVSVLCRAVGHLISATWPARLLKLVKTIGTYIMGHVNLFSANHFYCCCHENVMWPWLWPCCLAGRQDVICHTSNTGEVQTHAFSQTCLCSHNILHENTSYCVEYLWRAY